MSQDKLKELEKSLKLHAVLLERFLNDPKKDKLNLYLPLAGQLRVLLCDKDLPILITYAEAFGIPLSIVAPESATEKLGFKETVLEMNFGYIGWDSTDNGKTISIQEFLDKPIGVVPVESHNTSSKGNKYSPMQIIKWVANKEGITHLNFKKPATLTSLMNITFQSKGQKTEGLLVRRIIYQTARWAQIVIPYLLHFSSLNEIIAESLALFENIDEINPDSLPLLAHYRPLDQGVKTAYFEGEHSYKVDNFDVSIDSGFSWNGMIKIINQLYPGKKIFYEAGVPSSDSPKFSLYIDTSGNLCCTATINSITTLTTQFQDFKNSEFYDRYISLSFQLCFNEDKVSLSMYVNGITIDFIESNIKTDRYYFKKQVIGDTLKDSNAASFFLRELVLVNRCLTEEERQGLDKYLWFQWRSRYHIN